MKAPNWLTPVIACSLALVAYVSESTRTFAPPSAIPIESAPALAEPTRQFTVATHPDVVDIPHLFTSGLPTRPVLNDSMFSTAPARVPIRIVVVEPRAATPLAQKRRPAQKQIAQKRTHVAARVAKQPAPAPTRIAKKQQSRPVTKQIAATPRFARTETITTTETHSEQTFVARKRSTLKQKLGKIWIGLKSKLHKNSDPM